MLKPYVERRNNLVKEPANGNVLVSETRTFSNESRSSHFSLLREYLLIFPCVLFGTYLFVNFHN